MHLGLPSQKLWNVRAAMSDTFDHTLFDASVPSQSALDWSDNIDEMDLVMWRTTVTNFWKPEKHKVSSDKRGWNNLWRPKQIAIMRAFATLSRLDTIQTEEGIDALKCTAGTQAEKHVLALIGGIEPVHNQAYSFVFTSLGLSKAERDAAKDFATNHPTVAKKNAILQRGYESNDPLKIRIVSVMLESFAFFSGFFYPLYLASNEKVLKETAAVIKAILRDEATHANYIGYTFRRLARLMKKTDAEMEEYRIWMLDLFMELYEVELEYSKDLYGELDIFESLKKYLCYNGNRASQNLGYGDIFPPEACATDSTVLMAEGASVHEDFFVGTNTKYKLAAYEETPDSEWAIDTV